MNCSIVRTDDALLSDQLSQGVDPVNALKNTIQTRIIESDTLGLNNQRPQLAKDVQSRYADISSNVFFDEDGNFIDEKDFVDVRVDDPADLSDAIEPDPYDEFPFEVNEDFIHDQDKFYSKLSKLNPLSAKVAKHIQEYIKQLHNELVKTDSETEFRKAFIKERIEQLYSILSTILDSDGKLFSLKEAADQQFTIINNMLDGLEPLTFQSINYMYNVLNILNIDNYSDLIDSETKSDNDALELLTSISGRVTLSNRLVTDKAKELLLSLYNERNPNATLEQEDAFKLLTFGALQRYTLSPAMAREAMLQMSGNILKEYQINAENIAKTKLDEFMKSIKGVDLKDFLEIKDNKVSVISRYDSDYLAWKSNIRKIMYRSFKSYSQSEVKKGRWKELNNKFQQYIDAIRREEFIFDIRFLLDDTFTAGGITKDMYLASMLNEFTQEEIDSIKELALKEYKRYESDKKIFELTIEAKVLSNNFVPLKINGVLETKEQYKKRKIIDWDNNNNPIKMLEQTNGLGDGRTALDRGPKGQYVMANPFYRYIVATPFKNKPGDSLKRYNEKFESLTTTQKEAYNKYVAYINNLINLLPEHISEYTNESFFPSIEKDLFEKIYENPSSIAPKILFSSLQSYMESNLAEGIEQSNNVTYSYIDPKGRKISKVPIRFMEEMDIEKRSLDFNKVLELFTYMAYNYNYASHVKDTLEVFATTFSKEVRQNVTVAGENMVTSDGTQVLTDKQTRNLEDALRYQLDAGLYGKKRDDEAVKAIWYKYDPSALPRLNRKIKDVEQQIESAKASGFSTNYQEKELQDLIRMRKTVDKGHRAKNKRAKEIKKQLDTIKAGDEANMYVIQSNGHSVYKPEVKSLLYELELLGGKHLLKWGWLDGLGAWTQLHGLGFNPRSAVSNATIGTMQNMIYASRRKEYDPKDLVMAIKMFSSFSKANRLKLAKIMASMNVIFEYRDVQFDTNPSSEYGSFTAAGVQKTKQFTFILQKLTENYNQGTLFLAMALKKKVKDKDGNDISLWEAFDENGKIKETVAEDPNEWNRSLLSPTGSNQASKFANIFRNISIRLHGDYDPYTNIEAKKVAIGRALFLFRTWIPATVSHRWGKNIATPIEGTGKWFKPQYASIIEAYSLNSNKNGEAVSFMDAVKNPIQSTSGLMGGLMGIVSGLTQGLVTGLALSPSKFFKPDLNTDIVINGQALSEIDAENMRANAAEVFFLSLTLGIIATLIMLSKSLKESGDEDDEVLIGLMRVALFFAYRMEDDMLFYTSPFNAWDILRTPVPSFRAVSRLTQAMKYTARYLTDEDYGGMHPVYHWSKALPVANQLATTWYIYNKDISRQFNN
jgi:hypothetical protein